MYIYIYHQSAELVVAYWYQMASKILVITGQGTGLLPNHYLNRCWLITNRTHRNTFQRNFIQHSKLFINKNAFKLLSAKWRPFRCGLQVFSLSGVASSWCVWLGVAQPSMFGHLVPNLMYHQQNKVNTRHTGHSSKVLEETSWSLGLLFTL